MLAQLMDTLGANNAPHLYHSDTHQLNGDLPQNATSQFAAGFLYGFSWHAIEQREYILNCTNESDEVRTDLNNAFTAFEKNTTASIQEGNADMQKARPQWMTDMKDCDKTNKYYQNIGDELDAFFNTSDWNDTVSENYANNKKNVDLWWGYCLQQWNGLVYFDAGMFYSYIVHTLTGVDSVSP